MLAPRPRPPAPGRPPGPGRKPPERTARPPAAAGRAAVTAAATTAAGTAGSRRRRGGRPGRRDGSPGRRGRRRGRQGRRPGDRPGPTRAAAASCPGWAGDRRARSGDARSGGTGRHGRAGARRGPTGRGAAVRPADTERVVADAGSGPRRARPGSARRRTGRRRDRRRWGNHGRGGHHRDRRARRGNHDGFGRRSGRRFRRRRCWLRGGWSWLRRGRRRKGLPQPPSDRGLDRGRGALDVLTDFAELGDYFLAGDPELFGERGYAGLACHVTPSRGPAASRAVPLDGGRAHRWRFIECPLPSSSLRVPARLFARCDGALRTAGDVLAHRGRDRPDPSTRSARAKARRRSASSTQPGSGCSHAPRPGARRRGIGHNPTGAASTSADPAPVPRRSRSHDHAEQLGSRRPLATSDAGSDRARGGPGPVRTCSGRCRRRRTAMVTLLPGAGPPGFHAGGVGPTGRGRGLRIAVDVDAPAGQAGGEPGVLPFPADRERQLEVRHDDPDGLRRPGRRPRWQGVWPATARCRRRWPDPSAQSMMSIFSPCSSATTLRTRWPIGPMHAPFGVEPGRPRCAPRSCCGGRPRGRRRRSRRCRRRSPAPRARTAS